MKRKIRLLSVLSAVVMGTTMGLTACGGGGVAEHDHVWNDGEITKEATCQAEGTKTYTCTVEGCEQTKTEPVSKKAHVWNGGEVTIEPKCNKEGEKTFTCTNEGCSQTKTEPIAKTDHRWDGGVITKAPDFYNKGEIKYTCPDCGGVRAETVAAHADFSEQYYTSLTEQTGWEYGYAKSYDKDSGAVDFVRIEQTDAQSGSWKADGTEISKGRVYSQNNAVIAYRFAEAVSEGIQADIAVSFKGGESATVLNAQIFVVDKDGSLKFSDELNKAGTKDWDYNSAAEDREDIAQGDTYYLLFENKGEGKPEGSLSFTLTAPCLHVWNGGTVKEAASCKKEGVMEYTCLNCEAKRDGVIEKTDHTWDGGKVTKEATETEEGIRTYTCTDCGETKEEYIPRLGSSEFKGADYAADFSTVAQPDWKYGYTNNFNFENNTFKFNELKPLGEAWMDNGGIEIKSGWLKNETDGAQAIVRYVMPQTREINISLSFKGSDSVTRITGRLHILKPDGTVQSCDFIDGTQSDKWTFNKENVTVEKGSAISVIFFNEGSAGWYHGAFSMKLTAEGQALPEDKEIANFFNDFSTDGNNDWVYGYATGYDWGNNNFKFNALTANSENGEWSGTEGLCVKADWVLVEGQGADLAVGYKVPAGQNKLMVGVDFVGTNAEETRIAARIIVVGADGNTKSAEFISAGTQQASWNAEHTVQVADGDTVYVVLFREPDSGWAQGKLQVVINGKEIQQPAPVFAGANFANDFEATLAGNSNWECGKVDYEWSTETFTFNKITTLNGGGDALNLSDPWIEIKGDWMAVNGMMGFAYRFTSAASVNVDFNLHGVSQDGKFSLRWAVKDKAGNIKNQDGKAQWGTDGHDIAFNQDITVAAGDVLYLLVNKDEGGDQNNFAITLTNKETQQPAPEFNGANFAEDFSTDGNNGWVYGYASDYKFENNKFTFNALTKQNADEWGGYSGIIIKRDWILSEWTEENQGNANVAVGYKVPAGQSKLKLAITFEHASASETDGVSPTRFSTRILVVGADGNTKSTEFINKNASSWNAEHTVDVEEGDTVYVVLFREVGDWAQGKLQITIEKV